MEEIWYLKAKRLFKLKKMSHETIAKEFKLTPAAISMKLRGERESTWPDIQLFAKLLGVTPISLVANDPNIAETVMEEMILDAVRKVDFHHQESVLAMTNALIKK